MNKPFQDLMQDAARLVRSGQLSEATATIQRALGGSTVAPWSASGAPGSVAALAPALAPAPMVLDERGLAFDRDLEPETPQVAPRPGGGMRDGVHAHAALSRHYRLYMPQRSHAGARPLVVMLHGCTQGPDDFAAGTGMNALADEMGVWVLYPAQSADANPSRCWNWFKPQHQQRGRGEAAVIATMAQAVAREWQLDADRIYIAGLSAGGAMAALVAAAYPDVFAAVGVHSGLPPGAARSLPEGLAAMRSDDALAAQTLPGGMQRPWPAPNGPREKLPLCVPAIVFHGDADTTVHPRNAEQLVTHVLDSMPDVSPHDSPVIERGASIHGRAYTCLTYTAGDGSPVVEQWIVHGSGHAWSGGRREGSYTDPRGPDASREMLRFFLDRSLQHRA